MSDEVKDTQKSTSPQAKSLATKLCEVIRATTHIEKGGFNERGRYAYAMESDVLAAVRKELAARNVIVLPTVISVDRHILYKSQAGNDVFVTDVMVKWTFVDGDTGESYECMMPGCGSDTGDKGLYKAITGSSKYVFLKGLMLPTGDDPEKDSPEERKDQKKISDYQERAAESVQDKNIEMYQETNKQTGQRLWVFKHSEGERWLLDNGLKGIAKCQPITKLWYIPDEPQVWETLEKAVFGKFQLKKISHPQQPPIPAKAADPNHLAGVIMKLKEKRTSKGQPYVVMTLEGDQSFSVFDRGIIEWLKEGTAYVFLTEQAGKYVNVKDIISIGGVTLTRIEGKLTADIQTQKYEATDADLPSNMFPEGEAIK